MILYRQIGIYHVVLFRQIGTLPGIQFLLRRIYLPFQWELLLKERICSLEEKILSLRVAATMKKLSHQRTKTGS